MPDYRTESYNKMGEANAKLQIDPYLHACKDLKFGLVRVVQNGKRASMFFFFVIPLYQ